MTDINKKFNALLSHLNSEENEMAAEFLKELNEELASLRDDSFKLQCLENGGVDNWGNYHDALKDGGYFQDDEDEEDDD